MMHVTGDPVKMCQDAERRQSEGVMASYYPGHDFTVDWRLQLLCRCAAFDLRQIREVRIALPGTDESFSTYVV